MLEPTIGLRAVQAPLKERYREEPEAALVTLHAVASAGESSVACAVDAGHAHYEMEAHAGVGGPGTAACSGDLLLGALAGCAQITCQMVAAAAGIPVARVGVRVEGDLDLRGTLGMSRRVPVGFTAIRVHFDLDAPEATPHQREALQRATQQYCVVLQTLLVPPQVEERWG